MHDRTSKTDEDLDRSRGILSPADRKFLTGETEYAHQQSETDRRREIRHRVQDAILDFSLLAAHLEDHDFNRVFDLEDFSPDRRRAFNEGVSHALAFLYAGTRDSVPDFQHLLEDGVGIGERYLTNTSRVTVDVDIEFDIEKQRLDEVNVFNTGEKLVHHKFDDLSKGEMREYLEMVALGQRPTPSVNEPSEDQVMDYEGFLEELEKTFRISTSEGKLPLEAAEQAKDEDNKGAADPEQLNARHTRAFAERIEDEADAEETEDVDSSSGSEETFQEGDDPN